MILKTGISGFLEEPFQTCPVAGLESRSPGGEREPSKVMRTRLVSRQVTSLLAQRPDRSGMAPRSGPWNGSKIRAGMAPRSGPLEPFEKTVQRVSLSARTGDRSFGLTSGLRRSSFRVDSLALGLASSLASGLRVVVGGLGQGLSMQGVGQRVEPLALSFGANSALEHLRFTLTDCHQLGSALTFAHFYHTKSFLKTSFRALCAGLVERWDLRRTSPCCAPGSSSLRLLEGLGFGGSGFGSGVSGFGIQCSGSSFRVSGSGFGASGFGFRVLGLRFRVSGSGLGVSGFGIRV